MQVVWETKGQLNSRKEYISWEFKQDQKQDPHSLSSSSHSRHSHTHTHTRERLLSSKQEEEITRGEQGRKGGREGGQGQSLHFQGVLLRILTFSCIS